jgi:hypothetical protein
LLVVADISGRAAGEKPMKVLRNVIVGLAMFLSAGLLLYWGGLAFNDFRYERTIPRDLQDARWEGEFTSAKHPTSGRLLFRLPDPIPRDQEFEFEGALYYNVWSGFLRGKMARAEFVGFLGSESGVSAGEETRPTVQPRHFSFRFKGGTTPFPADIRYMAIFDRDDMYVAGSYSAQDGFDVGSFYLKKQ